MCQSCEIDCIVIVQCPAFEQIIIAITFETDFGLYHNIRIGSTVSQDGTAFSIPQVFYDNFFMILSHYLIKVFVNVGYGGMNNRFSKSVELPYRTSD